MGAPVFNRSLLDACAAGDIDGPAANPIWVSAARQLPLHRFDWWRIDDPGYPPYLIPTTKNSKPPPEILAQVELSPSTSGPWTTWDFSRPVRYTQLHYPGPELDQLKEQARADGRPDISRLDALLAHIWAAINRDRGHGDSTDKVFLNFTLGARSRVAPVVRFLHRVAAVPHAYPNVGCCRLCFEFGRNSESDPADDAAFHA